MAQARRASDECIFMLLGEVVEHGRTEDLFLCPRDPRTAEYVEGRYGSCWLGPRGALTAAARGAASAPRPRLHDPGDELR
jgi:hypothetical protein